MKKEPCNHCLGVQTIWSQEVENYIQCPVCSGTGYIDLITTDLDDENLDDTPPNEEIIPFDEDEHTKYQDD